MGMPIGSRIMSDEPTRKLKLLILGEPTSVHTIRWVSQLRDTGWDIILFCPVAPRWNSWPSSHYNDRVRKLSQEIAPLVIPRLRIHPIYRLLAMAGSGLSVISRKMNIKPANPDAIFGKLTERTWRKKLAEILNDFRPDIVHSLAINQDWRNLCLPILEHKVKGTLNALWIYSSWGTDLTFYPNLSSQNNDQVKAIVRAVDYFISECKSDYEIAVQYGFRGEFLGCLPAFGGIDTEKMKRHRKDGPVAARRALYIKGRGVEDPVGRALMVLEAVEKLRGLLGEYQIYIGQATQSVIKRADALKKKYGLNIHILPFAENPEDILNYVGSSRIFISITVNDGLPASLAEAMALGAFPIFANLPSIGEWITDGENGFLIDLNNPEKLAERIQQALVDDDLVACADILNTRMIREKLEYSQIRSKVISLYRGVAGLADR